ncbi:MAG: hypothetical protein OXE02_03420 [Chloroflexi bacterium]|nr:hypothetical protein [Chloroflexota bacterium]
MKRTEYLADPDVRSFLDWVAPFVSGERPLRQNWRSPRWGPWSCETLFDAYRSYEWPFSLVLPGDTERPVGKTYQDTAAVLGELSKRLRESAANEDPAAFLDAAVAVVLWGGLHRNERGLRELGKDALPVLTGATQFLDPANADLNHLAGARPMNSGFSKIYSLLIDGFPIYDSRVACALASLVRLLCEETGRAKVPEQLQLALPPSRAGIGRDPSCGSLVFRRIWTPGRYARSNVMAAWLLGALAANPPFSGEDDPLLAVESAMFMVGFRVYSERARRAHEA